MHRVEFGADGIRGLVGERPFRPSEMVKTGQALGLYIREQSEHPFVVMGRDTRPSGEGLLHCLKAGLTGMGVDVINLGVMTTPGVAFLARRLRADLGVTVSASHSPLECNGLKLVKSNGLRLQREEEIEIENLINECISSSPKDALTVGQESDGKNLIEVYIHDHIRRCKPKALEGFKVVLDCANGAASRIAPDAFRRLGAEVFAINGSLEGKSINWKCGSEHARECPGYLVQVMESKFGIDANAYGFAFDGDGDRLVVVDSEGRAFDGNDLLFVLANYYHSQGLLRGSSVVTIHQANRGLEDALNLKGIQTIYTDNGDRNVEAMMWGGDYLLGGEPGGNIIINDGYHTAADAVYTALVLGGVLAHSRDVLLGEMASPLQKRPQKTECFQLHASLTLKQKTKLLDQAKHREVELGEDSRILVWESTTEPGVIRVMVEGNCQNTLEEVSKTGKTMGEVIRQIVGESN
jgi:phosphoglucosamine mutase